MKWLFLLLCRQVIQSQAKLFSVERTVSVVVQTTLVSVSISQFYSDQVIQGQAKLFQYRMTIFIVGSISVSIA